MNTRYIREKILLAAAASLLLLTGCVHQGAYEPRATTHGNQEIMDNFVLLDQTAQQSVTCARLEQRLLADGRMEVVANIRNRTNLRLEIQVSCVFKDENGISVDETPFQSLILTENSIETVKFTSMNNKAKRFTVRVRQPR